MDISKFWKKKLREVFSRVWKCYRTDLTLEQESDKIRHDAIRYSSSMNFE